MEFLLVSHSLMWLLAVSECLSPCHGVDAFLLLSPIVTSCPTLSLPVPWRCSTACLTVSYCCWLSLTFFPVSWSCYIYLTISSISMELLHLSHCLPWLLAVSHSLSGSKELLHVHHCLSLLLALTVSPVSWSCKMSLTISNVCLLSLTLSKIPCSCCMSLTVSDVCWLSLSVFQVQ